MRKSLLTAIIGCIVILTLPVASSALPLLTIEAAVGMWNYSPGGDLAYEPISDLDTLDIEDDLNFDGDSQIMARFRLELPVVPNIYIMTTTMTFDEASDIRNRDFKFGDIRVENAFNSELTLNHYDIALYYGLPTGLISFGKLHIDVGINIRLLDLKAEISETIDNEVESEHVSAPIPMLYLAVEVGPFSRLSVQAEGRAIAYEGDQLLSLIARLKFDIFGPLYAVAGYRYDNLTVDVDDVEVETTFSGPFLEAGLKF